MPGLRPSRRVDRWRSRARRLPVACDRDRLSRSRRERDCREPGVRSASLAGSATSGRGSPSTIERPPALRATGCAARISTAVSLPSIARSTRNHVDAGNRRSAVAGTSIRSITTSVHTPRLHDEVERLDRAIDDALDERAGAVDRAHAGQPRRIDRARGFRDGLAAHPQQARQINAARVRRRRIEAIEGVDERYRFTAARGGSERGPCHARAPGRSRPHHFRDLASRQATGRVVLRLPARKAAIQAESSGATASSPRRSGKVEVSVRSSFRSRRRASTAARAAIFTSISLNFRHYSGREAKVKRNKRSMSGQVRPRRRRDISRDCILIRTQGRGPTGLSRQRLRTERAGPIQHYVAKKKPVRIIVRRGASRRFDSLRRNTADLPVEVSWDRRTEDRRESRQSAPVERRSSDRRKTPPFTWDAADFVVVADTQEPDATAAPRITRLDSTATSTAGDRNQKLAPRGTVKRRKDRGR